MVSMGVASMGAMVAMGEEGVMVEAMMVGIVTEVVVGMGVVEVVAMGPMEGTVAMTTEDMEVTGATMEEEEEEEVVVEEGEVSGLASL